MKKKRFKEDYSKLVIDSMKIQSFLERANGSNKHQSFHCRYLQLSLIIQNNNIDVSYFNDSICIRFNTPLANFCLEQILRLFPYDSFSHTIYSNGTYCIFPKPNFIKK